PGPHLDRLAPPPASVHRRAGDQGGRRRPGPPSPHPTTPAAGPGPAATGRPDPDPADRTGDRPPPRTAQPGLATDPTSSTLVPVAAPPPSPRPLVPPPRPPRDQPSTMIRSRSTAALLCAGHQVQRHCHHPRRSGRPG